MAESELHVTVRHARRDDLPGVSACLAQAFEPYREKYTANAFLDTVLTVKDGERRFREMTVLVAEDDSSRIVGTVGHQVVGPSEGHLRGLAVVPECQGRGVARRLLCAAESELRHMGCSRVTLDTTAPLARAIRFYARQGYKPTNVRRDFFGMPLFEYVKTWDEAAG